jgi:hypothetical protein
MVGPAVDYRLAMTRMTSRCTKPIGPFCEPSMYSYGARCAEVTGNAIAGEARARRLLGCLNAVELSNGRPASSAAA